jgi:hypothetical protein
MSGEKAAVRAVGGAAVGEEEPPNTPNVGESRWGRDAEAAESGQAAVGAVGGRKPGGQELGMFVDGVVGVTLEGMQVTKMPALEKDAAGAVGEGRGPPKEGWLLECL